MTKENKELTQMGVLDCAAKTHVDDLGIKSSDKLILLALCMHINKDISKGYWCNPSHGLLEREIGFKQRKISDSIALLQELGYIKSQSSKYSNTYYINAALIVEKHNLWRQSFKDNKIVDSPFAKVSSSALLGFDKAEVKKQEHVRNTTGFVQNKKPVVNYYEEESESPF